MKTTCMTGAFLVSALLSFAQQVNKPVTVRIKTVENVNGVQKIRDTSFTASDSYVSAPDEIIIKRDDGNEVSLDAILGKDNEIKHLLVKETGNGDSYTVLCNSLKEICLTEKKDTIKQVFIITVTNDADEQRMSKQTGNTDGMLHVEQMNFYPNPNNGRFNLSFTLPEKKGDTEIKVLDANGETVYSEKLTAFTGSYAKDIDIAKGLKGNYFVRVEQGGHALVKKVVVD